MKGQLGDFKTPMTNTSSAMDPAAVARQSEQEVNAARQQREQQLQSQVPPVPEIPKAQKKFDPKSHMALFGAMMLLSAMFGRKTGEPMTAAMNNMTASMHGMQQGNAELQQQNEHQMWQNFNAGMAAHKAAMEQYRLDLEKLYKDPRYGQNAVYLKMLEHGMKPEVAAMYSDPASAAKIYEANLKAHEHAMDIALKFKATQAMSSLTPELASALAAEINKGATKQELVAGWGKSAGTAWQGLQALAIQQYLQTHPGATAQDAGIAQLDARARRHATIGAQTSATRQAFIKYNNYKATYDTLDKNLTTWDQFASGMTPEQIHQAQQTFTDANKELNQHSMVDLNTFENYVGKKSSDPQVIRATILGYDAMTEYAKLIAGGAQSAAQVPVAALERASHAFNLGWDKQARQAAMGAIKSSSENILGSQREALQRAQEFGQEQGGAGEATPKHITSDAEYNALPSGTEFVGPDGVLRKKP